MYVEKGYANTKTTMATELCILAQAWVQHQREGIGRPIGRNITSHSESASS